jgi:hypothetical protein
VVHRARSETTSAFERRLAGLDNNALQRIDAALVALESALAQATSTLAPADAAAAARQGVTA